MIRLETAHIEEVRGIRKLDLDLSGKNVAIWGPNGSGKSGVIDAIEFALTGQIARLTGRGTKGLSVGEHGPHVDAVNFPDAAFVEVTVSIPSLKKTAKIRRKVSAPGKPVITPEDPDVVAVFKEIAAHPEITLARRDILRFILVEPAKRSEEVQAILKLDEIGHTRAVLNSAQNKLRSAHKQASGRVQTERDKLQRHLQIATFGVTDVLAAVNARRERLALATLAKLDAGTVLDAGISAMDGGAPFSKASALADLAALAKGIADLPAASAVAVAAISEGIAVLESDPAMLQALHRASLIELGLDLVDGPDCPLCDHEWASTEELLGHLKDKLGKSEGARRQQTTLMEAGARLSTRVDAMLALLRQTLTIAKARGDSGLAALVTCWDADLKVLKTQFATLDGLLSLKTRLAGELISMPAGFADALVALRAGVEALPDQSATVEAQSFLVTAQLRLADYRGALRQNKAAEMASKAASTAYDVYCRAMEGELDALYQDVQEEFSEFYRLINGDDEAEFTAKLTPEEGRLDLAVNFYGRGLFPPGAYHSEGHQDGMGVCLYLALMRRLFCDSFTLALLDDVVMSVDSGHRYQFCRLLKERFPSTQFVITTHDRLWAEQMRSAGLVSGKSLVAFHSWSVDTGPLVESNNEIWADIQVALDKNRVEVAAAALRHHLEFVARHLADNLRASLVFRADGAYELGDTLPAVLSRLKELYGKSSAAAQSWGDDAAKAVAQERKTKLSECNGAVNVEQWAVNKAVHYNQWANFGKKDFEPVVGSFKELLECMRCPKCEAWLYVTPKGGQPEALRCSCAVTTNMNLKSK